MNQEPRFPELILASGSRARRKLLERLGIPFLAEAADIDESPLAKESPDDLVERLSLAKADAMAVRHPAALVIGSDQVAVHNGEVTGKPGDPVTARACLERFSGEEVVFLTGLALVCRDSLYRTYLCDRTVVRFRPLSEPEIQRYVERDQPLDCAGSFRLESLGPSLFSEVRSKDPTALLGLPLIGLCELLRQSGYRIP